MSDQDSADQEVDLFVIGAGSGGVRAARIAANYGARVQVAEEYRVGGTCVIRGCVPKKLLVYASRFSHEFEDAAGFGWTLPAEPTFDWPTLIANKDREITRLEGIYISNLERSGAKVVKSRAVIEDANTVRLEATGERVKAKHILIATGGAPSLERIPGIEHVISSNEAFDLKALPQHVVVQGGGYIAVEFAAIFHGLGAQVTLVYRGENILRGFDDDVRSHLRTEMETRGIKIICGVTVASVEKTAHAYKAKLSDGQELVSDQVMFAIGRTPLVKGLGLEKVGIKLADNGGIAVDEYSRTSVPSVYAIGDVTNRINLTPVAIREGHALADTLFGNKPTVVDHTDVPSAVFSDPEIGCVGMTEQQARAALDKVDIYRAVFRPLKGTLSMRDSRMLMKLVVDGSTDRVVGCHVVGEAAAEMVQAVAIAVKMKATKADFDATVALHPTAAEELVTMRQPTARYSRS